MHFLQVNKDDNDKKLYPNWMILKRTSQPISMVINATWINVYKNNNDNDDNDNTLFSVCPTPPLMTPIPMNGHNDTTERVQFSESFHELRSEVFTVKVYTNIRLKLGSEGRICQLL